MRIVRPIVLTVEQVPRRVRDLQRLQNVSQILVRHGFGLLVSGMKLPGGAKISSEQFESTPARVVATLQELGPTFVKLGQILSTRPDLIPQEYCDALAQLQDDAGPIPVEQVYAQLDAELGEGWRDRIDDFDDVPLATASIAQVHTASLKSGEEVVLKVQRPGLDPVIRADLNILHFLAGRMLHEFPEVGAADLQGVLDEFERSIVAELDFLVEVRNQKAVAANFVGDERIRIPVVYDELCTSKVLCMERLRGVKITDARELGHDMKLVGDRALACTFDMLFVHGLFHADAHPGNVLVLPGDVVGLIDFGMVGRLTQEMRNDVIFIVFALQRGDFRTIARLFYEIAVKTERVDYHAVERDTVTLMQKHWSGNSIAEMQLGPYVIDLARAAAQHGARMPPDYVMFFKALVTVEGLAKTVIPEIDPIAAATPYFEKMIRDRLDLDRLQGDALYHFLTLSAVARRLPVSLSQFLEDLDAQRLRFEVKNVPDPLTEDRKDRRANRMATTAITVGAALCGTLALFPDGGWWGDWPVVTVVFYTISFLTGTAAFWMVALNRGR